MYDMTPEGMRTIKDVSFWMKALENEGITPANEKFDDIITGKKPPVPGTKLIAADLLMDGKKVDVYHLGNNSARLYLHIKE